MKRTKELADLPIPTGAEWLHTKREVLDEIVIDKEIKIQTVTKSYDTDKEYALIDGKREELKSFYGASYGQNTNQNILGVFAVGPVSNHTQTKKEII